MSEFAEVNLEGKIYKLPVYTGTENEKAIDISKLRGESGYVTIDPGFKNTGSTVSGITFLNGESGTLRYRGYSIEELADKSSFLEVAYLLIYGNLPSKQEFESFSYEITTHTMVNEDMKKIFDGFPVNAHPMGVLSSLVCSLSAFYPTRIHPIKDKEYLDLSIVRLLAKLPTIAAWSYKNSQGHPVNYPQNKYNYTENFLNMMFALPVEEYEPNPIVAKALDKLLILHADHEQNCSTTAVRLVGSSHATLYSAISAAICALWGPLHGGANQKVIEMLEQIHQDGGNIEKYVDMAKDKDNDFRLMGFGHRVYKNFDPRARIIKKAADDVLEALGVDDPLLNIARKLEEIALKDEYFVARKLYPNVDFYSGIIYKALNIPTNMFTVMFAIGRLPGWIAQWLEMRQTKQPIGRPRQIYTGETQRSYVDIASR